MGKLPIFCVMEEDRSGSGGAISLPTAHILSDQTIKHGGERNAQQHARPDVEDLRKGIMERKIPPNIPREMPDVQMTVFIDPTGRFVDGGPAAQPARTAVFSYGGDAI